MPNKAGEVRELPFLKNDMQEDVSTTGRPLDKADEPGKADAEIAEAELPKKDAETRTAKR
jgi:hypothetical protein